ncbi:4474_t:CDS:1, partial [Racocetra fulgida]
KSQIHLYNDANIFHNNPNISRELYSDRCFSHGTDSTDGDFRATRSSL